ncbi:response regulator [Cytobacillus sp. Hm23]
MLKVMIVEDEKPILDLMNIVINQITHLSIVGSFTKPHEALKQFPILKPDVVFLDVEMPKMTGIELAKKMIDINEDIQIVCTTAHEQYALDAFKVYAVDYLLKPVTVQDIEKVIFRLRKIRGYLTNPSNKKISGNEEQKRSMLCLGTFEVRNNSGDIVKWPTKKTEELFAYFLVKPNQIIDKWIFTELLWGDMENDRAVHNLYTTVYRLKKVLKEKNISLNVKQMNEGYMLNISTVNSDLDDFLHYHRVHSQISEQNLMESERAFNLYKGPLFGSRDYLWSIGHQEELVQMYCSLTYQLAVYYNNNGKFNEAEERLKTFLAFHPLHEKINLLLLNLYAKNDHNRLIKYFDHYASLLKQEMAVDPPLEAQLIIEKLNKDYIAR